MATETDTTMTISTPDGQESEPFTMEDLDAARQRLVGGRGEQLTFDTGAAFKAAPDFATLKIGGQFGVERDLRYKEAVTITVTDTHGEVICSGPATVGWPAFKDKTSGELTFTERAHTAVID